jgi:hypothetical protein
MNLRDKPALPAVAPLFLLRKWRKKRHTVEREVQ